MRVLLCVRKDYKRFNAGDSMYVSMIKKNLEKTSIEVVINDGTIEDFSSFDIIHLFNLTSIGETYRYFKIAKKNSKKIVISPMYWNLEKYYSFIGDDEKLKLWRQINCYRREILRRSDKVICSSETEKKLIQDEYGKNIKCEIVSTGFFNESDEIPLLNFKERYKTDDYVLAVGNISKRKNQLSLARATNELGIQLVLIGSGDKDYLKMCTENENVLYLGDMNSYFTYNAYKFAKVHAMPSFGEIPGLSSLAAAAYGCNLVCTTEGSSNEYFKDLAFYTSPYDKDEIKDTIYKAFNKPKNDKLKEYVRKNYSWIDTVHKISDIYAKLF